MSADVSRDCVEHTGRISALEEAARTSKEDRRDQWEAINKVRDELAHTRATAQLTLQTVQQMALEISKMQETVRTLAEAKQLADGARRRDNTILAILSTIAGGVGTYVVTHWLGGK